MSNESPMNPIIQALREIAPQLAQAIGEDVEVVLHDLSHPQDSLVAIAGNVTGRKVGAPLTEFFLGLLRRGEAEDFINYSTQTADGRVLRSSTIFIRDENGEPIGCLCINVDITKWQIAKHLTAQFCETASLGGEATETFDGDVGTVLDTNIGVAIEMEAVPVAMMKKEDKLKVVRRLEGQGVFLIKGAVSRVAGALDVSRYTVYNYLNEVRGEKSQAQALHSPEEGK